MNWSGTGFLKSKVNWVSKNRPLSKIFTVPRWTTVNLGKPRFPIINILFFYNTIGFNLLLYVELEYILDIFLEYRKYFILFKSYHPWVSSLIMDHKQKLPELPLNCLCYLSIHPRPFGMFYDSYHGSLSPNIIHTT